MFAPADIYNGAAQATFTAVGTDTHFHDYYNLSMQLDNQIRHLIVPQINGLVFVCGAPYVLQAPVLPQLNLTRGPPPNGGVFRTALGQPYSTGVGCEHAFSYGGYVFFNANEVADLNTVSRSRTSVSQVVCKGTFKIEV